MLNIQEVTVHVTGDLLPPRFCTVQNNPTEKECAQAMLCALEPCRARIEALLGVPVPVFAEFATARHHGDGHKHEFYVHAFRVTLCIFGIGAAYLAVDYYPPAPRQHGDE